MLDNILASLLAIEELLAIPLLYSLGEETFLLVLLLLLLLYLLLIKRDCSFQFQNHKSSDVERLTQIKRASKWGTANRMFVEKGRTTTIN